VETSNLLVILGVGLLAGWLADMLMKNRFGLIGDLIVGVIGSFIGGWLVGLFGYESGGLIGDILISFIGAVVLLFVVNMIKKK